MVNFDVSDRPRCGGFEEARRTRIEAARRALRDATACMRYAKLISDDWDHNSMSDEWHYWRAKERVVELHAELTKETTSVLDEVTW